MRPAAWAPPMHTGHLPNHRGKRGQEQRLTVSMGHSGGRRQREIEMGDQGEETQSNPQEAGRWDPLPRREAESWKEAARNKAKS